MAQARRFPQTFLTLLMAGTLAAATAQAQTLPGDLPPPAAVVEPGVSAPVDASHVATQLSSAPVPPPDAAAPITPEARQLAVMGPPPRVEHRFHTGRNVHVAGSVIGLVGNGLALTSIILTSVYGLDHSEESDLTRLGPAMAYAGASLNGAAFVLSAAGIGLQHSALRLIGKDPGRGLYAAGTALGILGLCGIGTSYFFRWSNYVDNSTSVAFGTSIAAAVLLTVSSVFYFSDATRVEAVYRRLTSF